MSEFDLIEGLDPTPLSSVSAAELLQMIRQASPRFNRGFIIYQDETPDIVATPALVRFLWIRPSDNPKIVYAYNTDTNTWEVQAPGLLSVDTGSIKDKAVTPAKIQPGAAGQLLRTNLAGTAVEWFVFTIADGSLSIAKLQPSAISLQFLRTNFDSSALEWVTFNLNDYLAVGILNPNVLEISGVAYDILMVDPSGTFLTYAAIIDAIQANTLPINRLQFGLGNQYLKMNPGGTAPEWASNNIIIPISTVDVVINDAAATNLTTAINDPVNDTVAGITTPSAGVLTFTQVDVTPYIPLNSAFAMVNLFMKFNGAAPWTSAFYAKKNAGANQVKYGFSANAAGVGDGEVNSFLIPLDTTGNVISFMYATLSHGASAPIVVKANLLGYI